MQVARAWKGLASLLLVNGEVTRATNLLKKVCQNNSLAWVHCYHIRYYICQAKPVLVRELGAAHAEAKEVTKTLDALSGLVSHFLSSWLKFLSWKSVLGPLFPWKKEGLSHQVTLEPAVHFLLSFVSFTALLLDCQNQDFKLCSELWEKKLIQGIV